MRRRKFVRKRRRFNWNNAIKTVGGVARTATTAMLLAGKVASLINTEWKYGKTVETTNTSANNSGTVALLTGIAQGDSVQERIGNSVLPKKFTFRMNAFKNASATTTQLTTMLILDKEYDGANPAVTDILAYAHYQSFLKITNTKRFKVLRVKRWTMDAYHPTKWLEWNIDFNKPSPKRKKWLHMRYGGTGSTASDCKQNQLILLTISDQAANVPTIDYRCTLRYIDN